MSEYQYYEFLALDRPLTDAEYGRVRALSTRAQITRTRFVNEYQWGDFRGDPSTLMSQFYDAHLYFANWGTRVLMLRLPLTLLGLATARQYADGDTALARRSGKNIILEWRSEDEDGEEDWEDGGPGPLAALVGVRAELAAGDLRPLYLGWLASIGADRAWDETGDDPAVEDDPAADQVEPPVPTGLNKLTAAQSALVDFLRVDRALLAAAAGDRENREAEGGASVESWIKGLTVKQRDEALRRLLADDDPHARAELLRAARPRTVEHTGPRRTISSLLAAASTRAESQKNAQQKALAEQRARWEEQTRRQRDRRLATLAEQGERPWNKVNALIAAKKASSYDEAVRLLSDLETISRRGGDPLAFARRLADLRAAHQRKPSLIQRLDAAGLP